MVQETIKKIFSHNYLAIIYFNFRMLPFKQAILLPFDFYYGIRFENLSGKVVLDSVNIHRGMIKIGGRGSEMFSRSSTVVDLKGRVTFSGNAEIGHGSLIRIEQSGQVLFGHNVRIGALSKVFCEKFIKFSDEIDFSWECQIFDTNFHFIEDISSGLIDQKVQDVIIGADNWFGNRVTVMKGTITPDFFTVASNSLCNKDYNKYDAYSIIGGIPAKLIAVNKRRLFENKEDVAKMTKNDK
jgi:acetyltransferase-like isoleucine patch superfamily enzyme